MNPILIKLGIVLTYTYYPRLVRCLSKAYAYFAKSLFTEYKIPLIASY